MEMMCWINKLLYRFAGLLLLAAFTLAVTSAPGEARESLSNTKRHQLKRLSTRERRPQTGKQRHVRVSGSVLSADELQLYRMLMDYRRMNGQPSIPLSPNLSRVAKLHVRDLEAHPPSGSCNLHSWSEYGPWKSVCYSGSESVEYMWSKPRELSGYRGNGYEVAASTSSGRMFPGQALSLWERSSSHNDVIVNSGPWDRLRWKAVGLAMSGSYAVVWFGEESDPSRR